MKAIKENESVVVLGKNIMPTLFNQIWLAEKEIIKKEEFSENIDKQIFAPQLSTVSTSLFDLLVLPQRVQVVLKSDDYKTNESIIKRVVGEIVKTLLNIEYSAVGANVTYLFEFSDNEKYIEKSRNFFICSENTVVKEHFHTPDSKFGFYCSKDFKEMRLKLDIKPRKTKDNPPKDLLALTFNFHFEVPEDLKVEEKKNAVEKNLLKWRESMEHSKKIVEDFEKMWEGQKI